MENRGQHAETEYSIKISGANASGAKVLSNKQRTGKGLATCAIKRSTEEKMLAWYNLHLRRRLCRVRRRDGILDVQF